MPVDGSFRAVFWVAAGGALGCVLRHLAGVWLSRDGYPWGTLAVNLVGSFAIALLMFGALQRGHLGPEARLFLVTGVLGGFTTMSSLAYETAAFVEEAQYLRAFGYASLSVLGSLAMAFLGRFAATFLP